MEDWTKYDPKFRYMMLSRMKQDCDYYIRMGTDNPDHLWAGNEELQIRNMVFLWRTFSKDEKPEWLTWYELMEYARKLGVENTFMGGPFMYFRKNREDDE